MENRVAIELAGEGCNEITDEELRALALGDYELGLTLKRQHWTQSGPRHGSDRVTALVEYHLENVAHAAIAQLDGRTLRDGAVQVRARHATVAESAQLLASGSNDKRTEFCGRYVPRDAAKLRRRVQLMAGRVEVELQMTTEAGTGGKLWDATPILAEWALQHRDLWRGRVVHELGAGLGLPGLALAVGAEPSRVVLSDCVQECLTTMQQNVRLNGVQDRVDVQRFDWRDATRRPRTVPDSLRADFVICSDVVYSREVACWLPQAALACLRPGGCLFALLPLSRMGCRECLHQLGEIMTPFDPQGVDPDRDDAMANWINQYLGANQLGHRIYGFRAPAAEVESASSAMHVEAARPCEEPAGSSAHSAPPAHADAELPSSSTWELATKHIGPAKVHIIIAQLRLPLLDSIAEAAVRVTGRTLSFEAPPGTEYTNTVCVELPVDMNIDVDRCVAKFSKRSQTLRVRIPVLKT